MADDNKLILIGTDMVDRFFDDMFVDTLMSAQELVDHDFACLNGQQRLDVQIVTDEAGYFIDAPTFLEPVQIGDCEGIGSIATISRIVWATSSWGWPLSNKFRA